MGYVSDMKRLLAAMAVLGLFAAVPAVSVADATHVVRKGDTLGKIARAYHVSVPKIKAANGLHGTRIAIGKKLSIPGAKARPEKPGPQLSLVDPRIATRPPDAGKLPSEADLAEAAKAVDAAAPAGSAAPEEPNAGESMKDRLLRVAHRMLSVPYRFGGTTLWGLDCSGFVQKAFAFLDLDLPRTAREQFREGAAVEKADLSPGDLVFFRTYAKYPSHVGIYLGDNRFVHASAGERKVTIDSLDRPYYVKRYIGAKRLLFEENDVQN